MKMKRIGLLLLLVIMTAFAVFALTGCGSGSTDESTGAEETTEATEASGLADGTYVVDFTTDNKMFHVNDANNDKGILTVKDGKMTVHVSLTSKKIVNLFPGTAADAQKEGAELLEPTKDKITYDDGYTEEVNGFDIPVPVIDEEFDVALIGTKGNWYDHKVVVANPVPGDDIHAGTEMDLEDGDYQVDVALEGGTGRATVTSPTSMKVENGEATLTLEWSSSNYDYMIVDGEKLKPVNEEGNSVFEVPVKKLNEPFPVIADTTAMSEPHEIDYTLTVTVPDEEK